MLTFVLKALSYGVLGLCAVMLVAAWRILVREQARPGQPRDGILRFTLVFMGFCAFLAILGSFVQLRDSHSTNEVRLRNVSYRLMSIHEAICQKAFHSVKAIEIRNTDADQRTLEIRNLAYTIDGLQQEIDEAWADTGAKKKLEPCR